jgi:Ca2+-binding RTX toxin-like protein
VYGSNSFAEMIGFVRAGGTPGTGGCTFSSFPTEITGERRIEGGSTYYDYLYGSDGTDALKGEYVFGFAGNDTISIQHDVAASTEFAFGGDGDDTIWGNSGAEELYGQNHNDEIHGGAGNDLIRGGSGNDDLYGDAGNDTIYGDGPDVDPDTGDIDYLYGGTGNDTLYGQYGDDHLDPETGTAAQACNGGSHNNGDYCRMDDYGTWDGCDPASTTGCEYDW